MATIEAFKRRYSFKSRRVFANIAQLEERAVEARKVLGSIPSVGTLFVEKEQAPDRSIIAASGITNLSKTLCTGGEFQ